MGKSKIPARGKSVGKRPIYKGNFKQALTTLGDDPNNTLVVPHGGAFVTNYGDFTDEDFKSLPQSNIPGITDDDGVERGNYAIGFPSPAPAYSNPIQPSGVTRSAVPPVPVPTSRPPLSPVTIPQATQVPLPYPSPSLPSPSVNAPDLSGLQFPGRLDLGREYDNYNAFANNPANRPNAVSQYAVENAKAQQVLAQQNSLAGYYNSHPNAPQQQVAPYSPYPIREQVALPGPRESTATTAYGLGAGIASLFGGGAGDLASVRNRGVEIDSQNYADAQRLYDQSLNRANTNYQDEVNARDARAAYDDKVSQADYRNAVAAQEYAKEAAGVNASLAGSQNYASSISQIDSQQAKNDGIAAELKSRLEQIQQKRVINASDTEYYNNAVDASLKVNEALAKGDAVALDRALKQWKINDAALAIKAKQQALDFNQRDQVFKEQQALDDHRAKDLDYTSKKAETDFKNSKQYQDAVIDNLTGKNALLAAQVGKTDAQTKQINSPEAQKAIKLKTDILEARLVNEQGKKNLLSANTTLRQLQAANYLPTGVRDEVKQLAQTAAGIEKAIAIDFANIRKALNSGDISEEKATEILKSYEAQDEVKERRRTLATIKQRVESLRKETANIINRGPDAVPAGVPPVPDTGKLDAGVSAVIKPSPKKSAVPVPKKDNKKPAVGGGKLSGGGSFTLKQ